MPYQKLLKVRVYDAEGNPVFGNMQMSGLLWGPAEIIGVDNGDIKGQSKFVTGTSEKRQLLYNKRTQACCL